MASMICCTYAATPEVPSVAAVRIVLARIIGRRRFADSVAELDQQEFEFCMWNSTVFVLNATECARRILTKHTPAEILSITPEVLDTTIAEHLIQMCLEMVPEAERQSLRTRLASLLGPSWDRVRVAHLLCEVLQPRAQSWDAVGSSQ